MATCNFDDLFIHSLSMILCWSIKVTFECIIDDETLKEIFNENWMKFKLAKWFIHSQLIMIELQCLISFNFDNLANIVLWRNDTYWYSVRRTSFVSFETFFFTANFKKNHKTLKVMTNFNRKNLFVITPKV